MQDARAPRLSTCADGWRWQPPPATLALTLSLCGAYAAQSQLYTSPDWLESLALGATTGWLVQAGEWFRLATASFAHISATHFAINTLGITGASWQGESQFGATRMVLLALSGALGGTLAASLSYNAVVLGSSTILFGLGAGVCVLYIDERPRSWLGLAVGVGLVLLVHAFAPWRGQVTFAGHFGAALAGATTAAFVHPKYSRIREDTQRRIATGGTLAFLALLAWGGVALARWDERALFAGAQYLYARESPAPSLVADIALEAYHSTRATPVDKQDARRTLQRVLRGRSRAAYPHAVEGHLLEHDGDSGAALRSFHEALSRDPQIESAHAVARLQDRVRPPLPPTTAITVARAEDTSWQVIVDPALGRGCVWHLLGRHGGRTRAVVHLALGSASRAPVALAVPERRQIRKFTWYVALEKCGDVPPDTRDAYYWSLGAVKGASAADPPGPGGLRDTKPPTR